MPASRAGKRVSPTAARNHLGKKELLRKQGTRGWQSDRCKNNKAASAGVPRAFRGIFALIAGNLPRPSHPAFVWSSAYREDEIPLRAAVIKGGSPRRRIISCLPAQFTAPTPLALHKTMDSFSRPRIEISAALCTFLLLCSEPHARFG